jgi:hypothetical protein
MLEKQIKKCCNQESEHEKGRSSMKKRARRLEEQFECYQLAILKWWLGYSSRRAKEEHDEHFNLALDVELLQPVKGVQAGHLTLYGSTTDYGGFLDYNIDRILRGALWIGPSGAAALANVLTARQETILELYGKPFRYRSAAIRDVCWYTKGHPSIEEL